MAPEMSRTRDSKKKAAAGRARGRPCFFCSEKIEDVDWKDHTVLRRFMSEKGKIRSRHVAGSCRRHQVQVGGAVKRAREMALLPYATR
jgi:small subunit ribosomal protein S18